MNDKKPDQFDKDTIEDVRQMAKKKNLLFGRRDWVMDSIALCVVIGFFMMTLLIALMPRDNSNHDLLNMLIGQLSAGFIAVLSFFFGSIRKP